MSISTAVLELALQEAHMSGTAHSSTVESEWTQHLVDGFAPVQAAQRILQRYAADHGNDPQPEEALGVTQVADLTAALLCDLAAGPSGQKTLELVSWLWNDGATTGRGGDSTTVSVAMSLLVLADRNGADVQDIVDQARQQLHDDGSATA
jgi:hypothetical protein